MSLLGKFLYHTLLISGVDRGMFDVFPGDHIVWSCWIKTSEPTVVGDNYLAGGRIGIDLYGDNGASFGIGDPKGLGVTEDIANTYVVFGTDDWTKVTIDFIVDDSYRSNQVTNGQGLGTLFVPTGCCIWIQTWSCQYYASEYGTAWFAHPELYINHSYNSQIDSSGISAFTAVAFLSATILILKKQLMENPFIKRVICPIK